MPQFHSKQKPTSPSVTPTSSNKAIGEDLWMKGNIKPDHKRSPFGENTSTSIDDGQSIPPTKQSATVACDIAGNDDVSIIPWTDCYPNDPDKARELATSTGVPGIQVYPVNIFSHASGSQVINAVDTSQNSDDSRTKMETQISPRRAADSEIESQTPVRTRHLTGVSDSNAVTDPMESWDTTKDVPASSGFCNWKEGNLLESDIEGTRSPSSDGVPRAKVEQQTGEQSKIRQGGIGTMGGSEKLPAGSAPETQNPRPGHIKMHAHSVNASNNPEVPGSEEIAQYFNPTNFPVDWGTEEGIDINSLLGDITNLDEMELPEAYAPIISDRDDLSQDDTSPTVCGPGSCKSGQLLAHQIGTSPNDLFDRAKDYGGMDASHGLPLISECVSEHDTEETTAKNKTQPETGGSGLTIVKVSSFSTPPLSAVGAQVSKLCTTLSANTDIRAELAVEAEKPRDDSEAEDTAETCDTDVDFALNYGARKITKEDFIALGLQNLRWAKLSDAATGPPPMSTEDLRGLENAPKDSPLLVGGANARDGSEENVTANKTGIDIGDSKLSVANANSLRSMEFVPPIDISGSQDSSGDALPGSSPKWQLPKADDVPQTIDSAKTPNVTNSDRADESVWVKVEMDTDNLPTQTDTVEVE